MQKKKSDHNVKKDHNFQKAAKGYYDKLLLKQTDLN